MLAQIHEHGHLWANWSGGDWLLAVIVTIIIVGAAIGVMYVALKQFGISIPPWVIQIFWIVAVAIVAVLAIKFLWSMF